MRLQQVPVWEYAGMNCEIQVGDVNVFQQGTFAPDTDYRWMGGIAMDRAGDIALAYNVSNPSIHPGIHATGGTAGDSPGQMESEISVLDGGGSDLRSSKWSDNSSMPIDAADDCTFWYTTQYSKTDSVLNWTTHIASFTFDECRGSKRL